MRVVLKTAEVFLKTVDVFLSTSEDIIAYVDLESKEVIIETHNSNGRATIRVGSSILDLSFIGYALFLNFTNSQVMIPQLYTPKIDIHEIDCDQDTEHKPLNTLRSMEVHGDIVNFVCVENSFFIQITPDKYVITAHN